ncbi:MAG: hypothetical protein IJM58_01390, partial [Muribaculaceae bacterium]|nr:hypothetical protein [Muribaculaceae bacterium]
RSCLLIFKVLAIPPLRLEGVPKGQGIDVTATAFGVIDAPQPPLIQEGELRISNLYFIEFTLN